MLGLWSANSFAGDALMKHCTEKPVSQMHLLVVAGALWR